MLAGCGPRYIVPGPATTAPAVDGDSFVARDGSRLPVRVALPAGPPVALVVALHSFGDYGAAFDSFGASLATRGIATYAFDQRGFGGAANPGRWAGIDAMVDDAVDFVASVKALYPEIPIYVLGESMGGSVAIVAAARGRLKGIAGLVLVSPGLREGLRYRYLGTVAYALAAVTLPGFTVAIDPYVDNLTPEAANRLTHDPGALERVRADTYYGLIRLADAASNEAAKVTGQNALLLFGGDDGYIGRVSVCYLLDNLKASRVTGWLYPTGVHRLLHQQRIGAQATDDIAGWIAAGGKSAPDLPAEVRSLAAACAPGGSWGTP